MSIPARDWAWQQTLPASAKLVLLALAERADEHGHAWPSLSALAAACGLARSTVERQLRLLEARGLVRRERRRAEVGDWDQTHYYLALGVGAQRTYEVGAGCTQVGAQQDTGRCTVHLGVGAGWDTEPSFKPSTEPSMEPSESAAPQKRRQSPEPPSAAPAQRRGASAKSKTSSEVAETTKVRLAIESLQGAPFPYPAKENAAIKRMLGSGYRPDEIVECWKLVSQQDFWRTRPLSCVKLAEYLPKYRDGSLKTTVNRPPPGSRNGVGPRDAGGDFFGPVRLREAREEAKPP